MEIYFESTINKERIPLYSGSSLNEESFLYFLLNNYKTLGTKTIKSIKYRTLEDGRLEADFGNKVWKFIIDETPKPQTYKHQIHLETMKDINKFVTITNGIQTSIKLIDGKGFCVNGKSLIGAMASVEWDSLYCISEEDIYSQIKEFCVTTTKDPEWNK